MKNRPEFIGDIIFGLGLDIILLNK